MSIIMLNRSNGQVIYMRNQFMDLCEVRVMSGISYFLEITKNKFKISSCLDFPDGCAIKSFEQSVATIYPSSLWTLLVTDKVAIIKVEKLLWLLSRLIDCVILDLKNEHCQNSNMKQLAASSHSCLPTQFGVTSVTRWH